MKIFNEELTAKILLNLKDFFFGVVLNEFLR